MAAAAKPNASVRSGLESAFLDRASASAPRTTIAIALAAKEWRLLSSSLNSALGTHDLVEKRAVVIQSTPNAVNEKIVIRLHPLRLRATTARTPMPEASKAVLPIHPNGTFWPADSLMELVIGL